MANPHGLKVDQTLWYVPTFRGSPHDVQIVKIGRAWATLNRDGRISIETLRVDGEGYTSPGRCYLSREDYEKRFTIAIACDSFKELIISFRYLSPGMTADNFAAAAALLGLEKEYTAVLAYVTDRSKRRRERGG